MNRKLLLLCCLLGMSCYALLLQLGSLMGGMGDGSPSQPHGFWGRVMDYSVMIGPFVHFIITGISATVKNPSRRLTLAAIFGHLFVLPLMWMWLSKAFIPFGAPALIYFIATLITVLDAPKSGNEPTQPASPAGDGSNQS